ncbi:DUF58 domain-containing protein [Polyangium aurulentum]|uniref:DUF58 domain-containing protein n=1 Tax=Polyangium aurulentum TaxID=2567896 RepID=UPI0010ADF89A|nr:DUF58 domain-containing protein [Polyangium aurulentum]UQA55090.1 DUF58 domain-containing protein [Polyangium aurulentum]
MGVLEFLGLKSGSSSLRGGGGRDDGELFDDEFQRKLDYLAMVSKRVFSGAMRAERRTKKTGSGIEFADHRDYAPGDDIRALDWHAFQRFDRLLIRLYEEEEDLSIYFILDTSSSMGFGEGEKLKQAKRLCAALAYVGLANLDRIAIVSATDEISGRMPTTRGKARIFRIFRFLSGVKAEGATDLGEAMKTFVAQHKRKGLAVLLSDLYDPDGFERGINVLRFNRFEPYVIHLVDPRDGKPELKGDVRVYDCETGDEREVTVTAKVLEKYQKVYGDYLEEVQRFCTSRQVSYFRADVDTPFDELILRVFRRGGFLR